MIIGTVVEGPTDRLVLEAVISSDALCAQPDYECTKTGVNRPCYRLTLPKYGKLLHRKGGEIKKPLRRYQAVVEKIAESWPTVCVLCSQAQRFAEDTVRVGAGVTG